jgi:hypothetical protein
MQNEILSHLLRLEKSPIKAAGSRTVAREDSGSNRDRSVRNYQISNTHLCPKFCWGSEIPTQRRKRNQYETERKKKNKKKTLRAWSRTICFPKMREKSLFISYACAVKARSPYREEKSDEMLVKKANGFEAPKSISATQRYVIPF